MDQSPLNIKPHHPRQLDFEEGDNDLGIKDIMKNQGYFTPASPFPKISNKFQILEAKICKKLDFASANLQSPILNKLQFIGSPMNAGKISQTIKKIILYDSPRVVQQFNQFSTEQRQRQAWQPSNQVEDIESEVDDLECDEQDQMIKTSHNLCSQCQNSYSKPPHQEEIVHFHSGSFGDQNPLVGQKQNKYSRHVEPEQFHDQSKNYLHINLISLKRNQEKKQQEPQPFFKNQNNEQDRKKINESYQTVRKRPRKGSINPTLTPIQKQDIKCNCNKSKCVKLYCDCFNAGQLCGKNCNCCECSNTDPHNHDRKVAIKQILDRDPSAFQPKVQSGSDEDIKHFKGCNCKKSNCLKKYCECYQSKVNCSDLCKCDGCKNCNTPQQSRKKGKQRIEEIQTIKDDYHSKMKRIRLG